MHRLAGSFTEIGNPVSLLPYTVKYAVSFSHNVIII